MSREIILTLAGLSLTGGACIALLTLVRGSLLARLPRRIGVMLWLIAALRLLLPLYLEVKIPITLAKTESACESASDSQAETSNQSVLLPVDTAPNLQKNKEIGIFEIALGVWGFGAAVTALIFIGAEHRLCERLEADRLVCTDELSSRFCRLCRELVPGRKIALYKTDAVSVPMTVGIFKSAVYLPQSFPSDEASQLVLSHELMHIRRGDLILKRIFCAAAVIHWFNPLVWLMLRQSSRDIELSCDEAVISRCPQLKKQYALCLIRSEELRCMGTAAFGGSAISERIEAIMKNNTKKFTLMGVAALIALSGTMLAMFVSASPEYVPEDDESAAEIRDSVSAVIVDTDDKVIVADVKPEPIVEETEPLGEIVDNPEAKALLLPLGCEYEITLSFGNHTNPLRTVFHDGIDLAAEEGSEIFAVKDGTVIETEYDYERGTYVKLDHGDGLYSLYQHCEKYTVKVGDRVSAGDVIALVGRTGAATGAHLHFSMLQGEDFIDVNPMFDADEKADFALPEAPTLELPEKADSEDGIYKKLAN